MGTVAYYYNYIFSFICKIKLLRYVEAILFSNKCPSYVMTLILKYGLFGIMRMEKITKKLQRLAISSLKTDMTV